jgi:hypothetical protein
MTNLKVWVQELGEWQYVGNGSDLGYTAENIANKAVAYGYASLGADGKVPSVQLPAITMTAVKVQETEPTSPEEGWVWIKPSTGVSKIYSEVNVTWYELANASGYVTTVNGQSGPTVSLSKSDLSLGNVANVDTTNASNISSGTLNTARLPIASGSAVGGVKIGSGISVAGDGTISTVGEANTASNVGTGTGTVYKTKVGVDLQLKTIKAGTGITITNNTDDITLTSTATGTGDVVGPSSATDNAITRFDNTTGKLVQNSLATVDDNGSVNIPTGQTYKINNVALSASNVGAAASSHTHAQSDVTNLTTDLGNKAALASPTFTGVPAAPTATAGTNTTQLATTEFVTTAVSGVSGSQVKVSSNDSTAGYLNGKLVAGTGVTLTEGTDGGNETLTIAVSSSATNTSTYNVQRTIEGVVYETTLLYWVAPAACSILSVSMNLGTNPTNTGSYCKVQVMKNGLLETNSIFNSDVPMQITEATSATNGIYQASGTLDSGQTTLATGDVIQFRVNQADLGSSDLIISLFAGVSITAGTIDGGSP